MYSLQKLEITGAKCPTNQCNQAGVGNKITGAVTDAAAVLKLLLASSVAVLAKILLSSPRKLVVIIIRKRIYRIKVSENKIIKI